MELLSDVQVTVAGADGLPERVPTASEMGAVAGWSAPTSTHVREHLLELPVPPFVAEGDVVDDAQLGVVVELGAVTGEGVRGARLAQQTSTR